MLAGSFILALAASAAALPAEQHHRQGSSSGHACPAPSPSAPASYPATNGTAPASNTIAGPGLNDLAVKAGKEYFGTAADIPGTAETTDPYYLAQFANHSDFGQATPANAMKWGPSSPAYKVYNWTDADYFVKLAKSQNQLIRCHNLVWHSQLPDWITNGNWTKESLLDVVKDRVTQAVTHFGDDCYHWDVVNEALNDDGTYRQSIFYNLTGFDYIATAFQTTQELAEKNGYKFKMYYNEYNNEYPGPKSTAAQNLIVKELQSRNIRIDGMGMQSHFIVGQTPSYDAQKSNIEAFTALGLETAVTELDIRAHLPINDTQIAQQVLDFNSTTAACRDVDGCVGITLWDFVDTLSWIPQTFPGQGYGTPWYQINGTNTPLVRKVAYDGIVAGLQ